MINPMPMPRNIFVEEAKRKRKRNSQDNTFGKFLSNQGLYDKIFISKENIFDLIDLVGGHVKVDIYCPECGESRVFSCKAIRFYWFDDHDEEIKSYLLEDKIISWQQLQDKSRSEASDDSEENWKWINPSLEIDTRLIVFNFVCAMDPTHHLDYTVLINGNTMKKIGQYPSVADLSFPELKDYRKVMSKEDEKELKRAVGLFAAGIGVGSFVYLRRIFERIIVSASERAITEGKLKKENVETAPISNKIKLLSEYLPELLVNSPVFYGIVSKGIHELSEEDCLEFFPIMKSFIVMILRQWEKKRRDEEENQQLEASLNSIATRIK